MTRMNGGQALVRSLAAQGLRVVFGVPGAGQYEAIDALYTTPSIRYISVRHEQAASYMADGYARASGEVGCGPGGGGPRSLQCHVGHCDRIRHVLADTGGDGRSSPPQEGAGTRRDSLAGAADEVGWPRPAAGRDSGHCAGGVRAATLWAAATGGHRSAALRVCSHRRGQPGAGGSRYASVLRWRSARD